MLLKSFKKPILIERSIKFPGKKISLINKIKYTKVFLHKVKRPNHLKAKADFSTTSITNKMKTRNKSKKNP